MKNPRAFLITVLFALLAGCGPGSSRPNIVLISIDTMRADRLGCYGNDAWGRSPSPVMDAYAERGVVFEQCFAPRGQTHPSIASMLTGKYPITHAVRENSHVLSQRHTSFIQHLKRKGYETAGFASNLYKEANPFKKGGPPNWWTRGLMSFGDGYANNFYGETKLAAIEDQWSWDERVEKQAVEWITQFDGGSGKPFFLWTHFYDPHKPYLPHESCPDFFPDYEGPLIPEVVVENGKPVDRVTEFINQVTRSGRPMDEQDQKKVLALYDASICGVDLRLGRIMDALDKKGMMENTWIFITSDHGDEMGDHNQYYYHGASIYNGTLRIPLIVVGPDTKAGLRPKCLVQNVDIAPTIMELTDIKIPIGTEGSSLLGVIREGKENIDRNFAIFEWQHYIYSYMEGRHKYIWNPQWVWPQKPPYMKIQSGFEIEMDELYDIEADPGELNNIFDGNEEIVLDLRKKLGRWIRQEGHDETGKYSKTTKESIEAVKSLGYTGGSNGTGGGSSGVKPKHPKLIR